MMEIITGLPDNVVGVAAGGKVTGADYDDVLITAIQAKLAKYKKIRLLYHLRPDFTGFTPEAIWDDAKIGLWHMTEFERVAFVTDVDWVRTTVKLLRFVVPCPMKIFANRDLAEARAWITQGLEVV
jgi:hypothetical protein